VLQFVGHPALDVRTALGDRLRGQVVVEPIHMIAIVLGAVMNAVRLGDEDPALWIEAKGDWIGEERFARHGGDCVARFNAERRGREIRGGRNCFAPNFLSAAGDQRSGDR
jgi:hypothetical protein